jgi:hypothetical protein
MYEMAQISYMTEILTLYVSLMGVVRQPGMLPGGWLSRAAVVETVGAPRRKMTGRGNDQECEPDGTVGDRTK